jgi:hypothetical protein
MGVAAALDDIGSGTDGLSSVRCWLSVMIREGALAAANATCSDLCLLGPARC